MHVIADTFVTLLQIPVAAKIRVTCPFVVPFNQASQVINCWSAQDVGNRGLHHRDIKAAPLLCSSRLVMPMFALLDVHVCVHVCVHLPPLHKTGA